MRADAPISLHPVVRLFPDMPPADYAALVEDIRQHGVRVPILVHGGQILDGRHRYRACRELGIPCPAVEWNGTDPWLEAQSRNLLRRHLAKDQICAIRMIAAERFPQVAAPMQAAKAEALQRKAQAKGEPRGTKALSRSPDRKRESADVIGAQVGVSGATVKRVERLARVAPELLSKVAAGELSAQKALRAMLLKDEGRQPLSTRGCNYFIEPVMRRLRHAIAGEWTRCPAECRMQFLAALQQQVHELIQEQAHLPGSLDDQRPECRHPLTS